MLPTEKKIDEFLMTLEAVLREQSKNTDVIIPTKWAHNERDLHQGQVPLLPSMVYLLRFLLLSQKIVEFSERCEGGISQ